MFESGKYSSRSPPFARHTKDTRAWLRPKIQTRKESATRSKDVRNIVNRCECGRLRLYAYVRAQAIMRHFAYVHAVFATLRPPQPRDVSHAIGCVSVSPARTAAIIAHSGEKRSEAVKRIFCEMLDGVLRRVVWRAESAWSNIDLALSRAADLAIVRVLSNNSSLSYYYQVHTSTAVV